MEFSFLSSLAILLFLLYAGAWISSAETALFSLSAHKVKTYKDDKDATKRLIAKLLAHPRDLLVTVFMINTCVNIFFQNVFSDMYGEEAGFDLKVGVPLIITLIFGEILPKYIGLENNSFIAYRVSPTLDKLNHFLKPIRKVIIAITAPISRILFFFLKKEKEISLDELEHVIQTSAEHGILNKEEAKLLEGFLHLQDRPIRELMWPKEDIIFYDSNSPLSNLVDIFINQECTRVPVCKGSLEHVLGIATAMDFFKNQHAITSSEKLIPFLQKPFYVPETTPGRLLLKQMDEASHILALVVDEYGSIIGLLSREDLIEVVIGHIEDEKETQGLFIHAGKHEVIASGKWELSEFNDFFHTDFKSDNYVTIGGWLTENLGDIPKSGTRVIIEGIEFQVLSASPTRIMRLFIKNSHHGAG